MTTEASDNTSPTLPSQMSKIGAEHIKNIRWIIAGLIAVAGVALISFPFIENYYNDKQTADMLGAVAQGETAFIVPVQPADANDTDAWMERDGVEGSANSNNNTREVETIIITSGQAANGGFVFDDQSSAQAERISQIEQPNFGVDEAENADEATLRTKKLTALGRIAIEKIDCELPVVEGAGKTELHYAVGHVRGTSDLGQMGNCVIAGHRNYTYGSMFNRLDEVGIGDDIIITLRDGTVYTYTVYDVLTLLPGDPEILKHRMDEYKLTVVTCTPVRVASHRLVLQARLTGINTPSTATR